MTAKQKKTFDFEDNIKTLEALVESLEDGELSLEASLETFEKGVALTRACQQHLAHAEQRIAVLVGEGDKQQLVDFEEGNH